MGNIALNKNSDASSYVNPFTASRGVNGTTTPISRWVGSSPVSPQGTPAPIWMRVDFGAAYWINRWVVKQMGFIGWSPNYNLMDYKFQGSLDNVTWFDLDSVTNNTLNSTDRTIAPRKARWVRVYITKGLRNNTNFASIAEFEVYEAPPTDSTLSALSLNSGTIVIPINPPFVKTTYSYTSSVGYDISSVMVTPTATDPNARITVNGTPVQQGQPSQPVSLNAGAVTPVNVVVTPAVGDPKTYTVNVTRASSPYLSGLTLKKGKGTIFIEPSFDRGILSYNAIVDTGTTSISVIATVEESNATIKINNTPATSGQPFAVQLDAVVNPINIEVTSGTGIDKKLYVINVSKQ